MSASYTLKPLRQGIALLCFLLLPAAICPAQGQASGGTGVASTAAPAAPVRTPEMEKMLKSVEELVAALDAQIKNLEAKYLLQRKQAADAAASSAEKEAAATSAAKLADLLKATAKERDALATQIASMRSLLGLPAAPATTSPAGTSAPAPQAPPAGVGK